MSRNHNHNLVLCPTIKMWCWEIDPINVFKISSFKTQLFIYDLSNNDCVCVCFSILKIKNVDMSILQVKNLAIY
jgi:hypothetical protein